MTLCTEKKTFADLFSSEKSRQGALRVKLLTILLMISAGMLNGCQTLNLALSPDATGPRLTGRWTIHYLRSAESILKARGGSLDAGRIRNAEIHLKQKFYGEFEFTEKGDWSLFYRVEGREKKGRGRFEVRERQGQRLVLTVTENPKGPEPGAPDNETLLIEFLDADLMLLSKQGETELPPLVFQRESGVKP